MPYKFNPLSGNLDLVNEPQEKFSFNSLMLIGDIWNSLYDPENWSAYIADKTNFNRMAKNPNLFTGMKWMIATGVATNVIGPFESLSEYADAILALNDNGNTLKVTPFYEIDSSLNGIVTSAYAFSSPVLTLGKIPSSYAWHRKTRRVTASTPTNALTGSNRDVLLTAWDKVWGYTPTWSDPLPEKEANSFFRRRRERRPTAFPYLNQTRLVSTGSYNRVCGYDTVNEVFDYLPTAPTFGISTIGEVKALVTFDASGGLRTPNFVDDSILGLKKFKYPASLTTASLAFFPVTTESTFNSVLYWSHTLDSIYFSTNVEWQTWQTKNYGIEATVIEPGILMRYDLGIFGINTGSNQFQVRLSGVDVRQKEGTLVRFRLKDLNTNKVSPFLPAQLRVKKLGPILGLICEPLAVK